jgi:anti-anti-sigma regulatory factor
MAFRIETAARGRLRVFILSGRIEAQAIAELRRLLELQARARSIVIDLKDVTLVDREGMLFLMGCEACSQPPRSPSLSSPCCSC